MWITMYLTNKVSKTERVYDTFFDYLSNLGGIFETIMFGFAFGLLKHSAILMHLYLLNTIALEASEVPDAAQELKPKKNQLKQISLTSEENYPQAKPYTYREVAYFQYFGFYNKKNPRYIQYEEHERVYKKKLSIIRLIINQGYSTALQTIFMKPFQIKLVSELMETEEKTHSSNQMEDQGSLENALKKLES